MPNVFDTIPANGGNIFDQIPTTAPVANTFDRLPADGEKVDLRRPGVLGAIENVQLIGRSSFLVGIGKALSSAGRAFANTFDYLAGMADPRPNAPASHLPAGTMADLTEAGVALQQIAKDPGFMRQPDPARRATNPFSSTVTEGLFTYAPAMLSGPAAPLTAAAIGSEDTAQRVERAGGSPAQVAKSRVLGAGVGAITFALPGFFAARSVAGPVERVAFPIVTGVGLGTGLTGAQAVAEGRAPTADELLFGAGFGLLPGLLGAHSAIFREVRGKTPREAQPILDQMAKDEALPTEQRAEAKKAAEVVGKRVALDDEAAIEAEAAKQNAPSETTAPSGEPKGEKPLKLVESAKSSPELDPEFRQQIEGFYTPITNAATLAEANRVIDAAPSLDRAKADFLIDRQTDAVTNARGLELVRRFNDAKQYGDAADVLYDLALRSRTQGQAIQVLSTLARSTPEGMQAYATKIADRPLTPKESEAITTGMKKVAEAKNPEVKFARAANVLDDVHSLQPVGLGSKLRALQNLTLLLNPKTTIRNIAGNVLMSAADLTADSFIPLSDYYVSAFTGKRTVQRVGFREYMGGLAQPAKDLRAGYEQGRGEGKTRLRSLAEGVKVMSTLARLTSAGHTEISDVSKGFRTTFSNRYMKMFEHTLGTVLGVPDRAFYVARLKQSLYTQQKAARALAPTAEMLERAAFEANRAIFQDKNFLSRSLNQIRKTLNELSTAGLSKDFGVGQAILPFTQVPGSIVLRGLEYTPAGFIRAAYDAFKPLFSGTAVNQREIAQMMTRALTGTTALITTGYLLNHIGVITGVRSDNASLEALKRQLGVQNYAINVSELKRRLLSGDWDTPSPNPEAGDVFVDYDWAQPAAFPLAIGADLNRARKENNEAIAQGRRPKLPASVVLAALTSGGKTLIEQPLMSGLARMFGKDNPIDSLAESALNLPGVFVPTAVRQIQQLRDNAVYETRSSDLFESTYARMAAGIPFVAESLGYKPAYTGTGEVAERYQDHGNTFFNVLVNPAIVTKVRNDPQLREAYRLWEETGKTGQVPRKVARTITISGEDGKPVTKELTAAEASDYQQLVGRLTRDIFNALMTSPDYVNAGDEEKAKGLAIVISDADSASRIVLFGHRPQRPNRRVQELVRRAQQTALEAGLESTLGQQRN